MKKRDLILVVVSAAMVFAWSSLSAASDIETKLKEKQQQVEGTIKGAPASGLEAKIMEQHQLIDKAVSTKALTKDEGKVVQENLHRIRERKNTASAEGKLDDGEVDNIQNMLDRNNRMITDKKNNPVHSFSRPEITHRFANQQKRIDGGVKSGKLTKQEAATLQGNLTKAKAKYEAMNKDGKFTQAEEEKMNELLDKDAQIIYRKKHN
jgi:polyhydroxyalkanoate synthesis regulator phasin